MDANILVLGAQITGRGLAAEIVEVWLETPFEGGRHERRIEKIRRLENDFHGALKGSDSEIYDSVKSEIEREEYSLILIASENYVDQDVLEAQGTILTNKYAEGYPGRRFYGGCRYVDAIERTAIERACKLFGAEHANVQPHSGSSANMAVFFAVLGPGDKILGMDLAHGGHLTHGARASFSGRFFKPSPTMSREKDEQIDYDEVRKIALAGKAEADHRGRERLFEDHRFQEIQGDSR